MAFRRESLRVHKRRNRDKKTKIIIMSWSRSGAEQSKRAGEEKEERKHECNGEREASTGYHLVQGGNNNE